MREKLRAGAFVNHKSSGYVAPAVWLAVAFAGGIVLTENAPDVSGWVWPAVVGAGLLGCSGLMVRTRPLALLVAVVAFGLLGMADAGFHVASQPTWPPAADGQILTAAGVVRSPPEPAGSGWRAVVDLTAIESPAPDAGGVRGSVRVAGRGDPPRVDVGDRVRLRGWFREGRPPGNPGERSERDALRRRGLSGTVSMGGGSLEVIGRGSWSVQRAIAAIRRRIVDAVMRALPPPDNGLLLSLLLGIDGFIAPDLYREFVRAGLVHLMVVSGAQVAIVAGAVAAAARMGRLSRGASAAITGAGIATFAVMVGWAPSIGRAVVMGAIGLAGVVLGRPRDRGATIAAGALVLLALNPPVLFDIGFQLSFAATWGLLFAAPALRRQIGAWTAPLGRVGGHVADAVSVTLGAHLAVTPLLAAHFQTLPLAGLVANVLAVPLIAVLVPAGFVLLPPVVAVDAAGPWLLGLLRPALAVLLWITHVFARSSWAALVTPPVPPVIVAAWYALLGGGIAVASGGWNLPRWRRTLAATAGIVVFSAWHLGAIHPPPVLIVTALDVGQGDAILIQTPGGRTVLIDGGGEPGAARSGWDIGQMRVVPALRRAGVRRLDIVLLSHPHEDHVGGLPAVMENFPVGLVLDPGVPHPSPSYLRLLRMTEAGRIAYRKAREGQRIDLGAGTWLSILYPPEFPPTLDGDPVHARSVMARLTYGRTAVLFAGDIEGPVERYLVDRGVLQQSQVLKVGHHGSKTSTTPLLLAHVRPQIAVISVGAGNSFGHPHQWTLDALEAIGAVVYRTDHDGAVRVTSDGSTLRVETTRATEQRGAGRARFR